MKVSRSKNAEKGSDSTAGCGGGKGAVVSIAGGGGGGGGGGSGSGSDEVPWVLLLPPADRQRGTEGSTGSAADVGGVGGEGGCTQKRLGPGLVHRQSASGPNKAPIKGLCIRPSTAAGVSTIPCWDDSHQEQRPDLYELSSAHALVDRTHHVPVNNRDTPVVSTPALDSNEDLATASSCFSAFAGVIPSPAVSWCGGGDIVI